MVAPAHRTAAVGPSVRRGTTYHLRRADRRERLALLAVPLVPAWRKAQYAIASLMDEHATVLAIAPQHGVAGRWLRLPTDAARARPGPTGGIAGSEYTHGEGICGFAAQQVCCPACLRVGAGVNTCPGKPFAALCIPSRQTVWPRAYKPSYQSPQRGYHGAGSNIFAVMCTTWAEG